jgi:hypothetical protein
MEIEWILQQVDAPRERLYMPLIDPKPSIEGKEFLTTLQSREWISFESGQPVAIDATIVGMAGVLGFSKKAIIMDIFREQDTNPNTHQYLYAEGMIVEQTTKGDDQIQLTALRDPTTLADRLCDQLKLTDQQPGTVHEVFECKEENFAEVPHILAGNGENDAISRLVEIGMDEQFAQDLVRTMSAPLRQSTLQVLALGPKFKEGIHVVEKLTFLEGVYNYWALHSQSKKDQLPRLQIMNCNAQCAKKRIDDLLDAFFD